MQVRAATNWSLLQSYFDETQHSARRLSKPTLASALSAPTLASVLPAPASVSVLQATSKFSAGERTAIFEATGGVIGDDGIVNFTVGSAAGKNLGKIPEGSTSVGLAMNWGSVVWYGAARPSASADGPGQNAALPQSTLTGMQIIFAPGASSEERKKFLDMALGYVHALNTGQNASWAPHAIFDVRVGG